MGSISDRGAKRALPLLAESETLQVGLSSQNMKRFSSFITEYETLQWGSISDRGAKRALPLLAESETLQVGLSSQSMKRFSSFITEYETLQFFHHRI
jgi:hypothetical protein